MNYLRREQRAISARDNFAASLDRARESARTYDPPRKPAASALEATVEAFRETVVVDCQDCGGSGRDSGGWDSFAGDCPSCAGSGREIIQRDYLAEAFQIVAAARGAALPDGSEYDYQFAGGGVMNMATWYEVCVNIDKDQGIQDNSAVGTLDQARRAMQRFRALYPNAHMIFVRRHNRAKKTAYRAYVVLHNMTVSQGSTLDERRARVCEEVLLSANGQNSQAVSTAEKSVDQKQEGH